MHLYGLQCEFSSLYSMYLTACFIPAPRNVNVRGRIALSVKCVYGIIFEVYASVPKIKQLLMKGGWMDG